ncbi:MAG: hypothetical protein KJO07_00715, partial [Deltaproteobacteria bacterium]|nr:hypothetical protein [Deltaproteobacteria bacterium]
HSQGPVRPRLLRADMPERLEELILRALAVDRDLRFQTASAMTTAIEEVCVELPSGAFTPIVVPGSRLSITIPALSPTQVSRTAATSLERPRQRAAQQLVTAATALERPPLPRAGGPIAEAPRSDRSPLVRARYLAVIAIVAAVSIGLTYSLLGASGGGGDPSVELHDPPPNWRPPKLDFYADAQALVHGSDHQIRSQYERAGSLSLGPAVKEARSKVRAVLPDSELAGLTVVLAGGSPANVTMFFDSPSAMKTGKLCRMMVNVSSTVAYVHEPTRIGCRGAIPVPRCPVAQVLRYNLGKGRPRLLYYGPGGWWILNGQAQQAVGRPPC